MGVNDPSSLTLDDDGDHDDGDDDVICVNVNAHDDDGHGEYDDDSDDDGPLLQVPGKQKPLSLSEANAPSLFLTLTPAVVHIAAGERGFPEASPPPISSSSSRPRSCNNSIADSDSDSDAPLVKRRAMQPATSAANEITCSPACNLSASVSNSSASATGENGRTPIWTNKGFAEDEIEDWLWSLDGGKGLFVRYIDKVREEFDGDLGLLACGCLLEDVPIGNSIVAAIDPCVYETLGMKALGQKIVFAKGLIDLHRTLQLSQLQQKREAAAAATATATATSSSSLSTSLGQAKRREFN
mmetsp:Transcript_52018/g.110573  ORF Transcript_52018/g.110573 Transcript_52018/m.110573 type:complete len:298 (+) Transcript_52018:231-1124(+)